MNARLKRWSRGIRAFLSGPGLERALQRHRRAADELDRAVREVLER